MWFAWGSCLILGEAMTNYEIYVFILCSIVFTMFTVLFAYIISLLTKMRLKMIEHGLEDEEIIENSKKKKRSCLSTIIGTVLSLIICVFLSVAFAFSLYMNATEGKAPNGIPSLKVVKSSSMATANEKNKYLAENNLTNQLQTFDIVITHHLPKEEDLKLYDIVVYKQGDNYIIHRIIAIEEPNEKHPNSRHFLLRGDSVPNSDPFPVLYSQMQGIYEGERIPYVGSFVLFMQSPAGWLCIILVLFAIFATPVLEKKINESIKARYELITSKEGNGDKSEKTEDEAVYAGKS